MTTAISTRPTLEDIAGHTSTPTSTLEQALADASNPRAAELARALVGALTAGPTGTMRTWMEARHGRTVDTVQISPLGAWAPLGRHINAARATYVTFDGSRRDYAGMRVLGATAQALVVTDGEDTVLYVNTP